MNETRDSKIEATLSGLVILGFLAIMVGNVFGTGDGRWHIVAGLALGTVGAGALSARVFWRHRIGLSAWMLMFGVHASGMALATQLFNWLHKGDHAASGEKVGINALLLTVALLAVLLVRGAVLQAAAKDMPPWMAARSGDTSATPRLWLFALYWISPLAWWAGILCAVSAFNSSNVGAMQTLALIVCIVIAVVRIAVRFVLFEKNKYSNWRRSPQGAAKFRAAVISIGFVLSGAVTFYAYFFMASRVQDDALDAALRRVPVSLKKELEGLTERSIPLNENAVTIYELAYKNMTPINWEWAEKYWRSPEARTEVARNLTALSYLRQGAEKKATQFSYYWAVTNSAAMGTNRQHVMQLYDLGRLELRQSTAMGNWQMGVDDFQACMRYSLHASDWPVDFEGRKALEIEEGSALTLAAALFQQDANPSDAVLESFQGALAEHFAARGEFVSRRVYAQFLGRCYGDEEQRAALGGWPGRPDGRTMVWESAFKRWQQEFARESLLSTLRLSSRERMDREATTELLARMTRYDPTTTFAIHTAYLGNIDSMEALRLLEAAIGVKRYQRKHGAWPNAMADCVPEFLTAIPPDPNKRGRFIQYEASPPRVYTIGTGLTAAPEQHGFPDENYFQGFALKIKECENGNRVLFLAN